MRVFPCKAGGFPTPRTSQTVGKISIWLTSAFTRDGFIPGPEMIRGTQIVEL